MAIRLGQTVSSPGTINVKSLGAVGNGSIDDTTAIQAAIDAAIIGRSLGQPGVVFFPNGRYKISAPLHIYNKYDTGGGIFAYTFGGCSLVGESATFGTAFNGVSIETTYNDKPAIIITGGRAVRIENLMLTGKNAWTYTDMSFWYDNANIVTNGCRDNRYSPHAGIVIDCFELGVAGGDQYPGMGSSYLASAASSDIVIKDCQISQFVVGIGIGMAQVLQNAENITIKDTFVGSCKAGIVVGQGQSRNVNCYNISVSAKYCIDTADYGQQGGATPNIYGANMGGWCLFNLSSAGDSAVFNSVYSESVMMIGQIGGVTATFNSCMFSFSGTPNNKPAVDFHLHSTVPVTMNSCNIGYGTSSSGSPLEILKFFGPVVFNGCLFGMWQPGQVTADASEFMQPAIYFDTEAEFHNCRMIDTQDTTGSPFTALTRLSSTMAIDFLANYNGFQAIPGSFFYPRASAAPQGMGFISGPLDYAILGNGATTFTVTNNGDGTASVTLNPLAVSVLKKGDVIISNQVFFPFWGQWISQGAANIVGKVKSIVGNDVVLNCVSPSITNFTAYLYIWTLPRIHQPSYGSWTGDQVTLTTSSAIWKIGQRIYGDGFVFGTRISNIIGSVLTVSPATNWGSSGRLYDADIKYPTTSTSLANNTGVINVKDYNAKGDNAANDTVAIATALAAAIAAKAPLFFPPGTYVFDSSALDWGTAKGIIIRGAGVSNTILKPRLTTGHGIEVTGGWTYGVELSDFSVIGAGVGVSDVNAHGIYFHDNGPYGGVSHMVIRDISISGFGGRGLYIKEQWHSRFENIMVSDCGHNAIDIQGGNTTTLIRCYPGVVAKGRCGYRIHGGATMIACNGINNDWSVAAQAHSDWGQFGNLAAPFWAQSTPYAKGVIRAANGEEWECITAGISAGAGTGPTGPGEDDVTDNTVHWRHIGADDSDVGAGRVTSAGFLNLIQCNLEDFTRFGYRAKTSTQVNLFQANFSCPAGGTGYIAGIYDFSAGNTGISDATSISAGTKGGTYANSCPWHTILGGSSPGLSVFGGFVDISWFRRDQGYPWKVPEIGAGPVGYFNNAIKTPRFKANAIARTIQSLAHPGLGGTLYLDPASGTNIIIDISSSNAFTISDAEATSTGIGSAEGTELTITFKNTSGGFVPPPTFAVYFIIPAAFGMPATGYSRSITFRKEAESIGGPWKPISWSVSDVPTTGTAANPEVDLVAGIAALPTAGVGYLNKTWIVPGGAGVADQMYICLKSAADTYSWKLIVAG